MPTISSRDRITLKEWLKRYNRKVSFYDKETKTITVPTTLSSIYYLTDYEVVSSDSHSVFMKKRTTPLPELPSDQVTQDGEDSKPQDCFVVPYPPECLAGLGHGTMTDVKDGCFAINAVTNERAREIREWIGKVSDLLYEELSNEPG